MKIEKLKIDINYEDFEKGLSNDILKNGRIKFEEGKYKSVSVYLVYDIKHIKKVNRRYVVSKEIEKAISQILNEFSDYHDSINKPLLKIKKSGRIYTRILTFYRANKKAV